MLNDIKSLTCRVNSVLSTPCECAEYLTEAESAYLTTCENSVVTLTATTEGRATVYQWQVFTAGEWVDASGTSDKSTYTSGALALGSHQFRVVVADCYGCESISDSVTITVVANTLAIYISAEDNEFCGGGSTILHSEVFFDAVNIDGNANLTVTWQISSEGITYSNISTGPTLNTGVLTYVSQVAPYDGTPYFYRAIATYNGCSSSTEDTLTDQIVVAKPQPYINYLEAEDATICDGGTAIIHVLTINDVGSSLYQWQEYIGGVWVDIEVGGEGADYTTPTLTEGTYTYRIVITQDAGCRVESNPVVITVVADPVVTIVADDNTISVGGSFVLTSNVVGGNGPTFYQWQLYDLNGTGWTNSDIFGANNSTFDNVAHELAFPSGFWDPIAAGAYLMRVQVGQDSGCEDFSNEITITVS